MAKDPICLPAGAEGKDEVYSLWYSSGNGGAGAVVSAQCDGALTGEARAKFLADQQEILGALLAEKEGTAAAPSSAAAATE